MLRTVNVTRYITPLREGGSMPAIVEADDDFMYALKFKGAGQGVKALIAEIIGGEMARLLGLKVPELVFAILDEGFGQTEPDEEIQDLLKFSVGKNLALHYLSGSITFDPVVNKVDEKTASIIVWLDAFLMNMDRTARNTNMLMWNKELWMIDHGASLYFHHTWQNADELALKPFSLIKDHVLLPSAHQLEEANVFAKQTITQHHIENIVNLIPDEWLIGVFETPQAHKEAYITFLSTRLAHSHLFLTEALHAKQKHI